MKKVHLGKIVGGKQLHLPLDAVTQTFSILAKRGVGKTYTAAVMAEGMLEANMQVVVIDPMDAWWGLRAPASGKGPGGYPITIFGGEHGDLPLHKEAAETLADLVAEERISCVLSLDHLRKNDQRYFVMMFSERLYHRKSKTVFRTPVHIFIDEADRFCPQRVHKGQERMLGAVDDLVRRGRVKGIGVTLITQRAASINKDAPTQSEVLIALQNVSPQDRKAIGAWIEEHDAHGQKQEFDRSLASLPIGTAWFWSPGWIRAFHKVQIRKRRTFDSSKTPELGKQIKPPKRLAKVDLEKIGVRIDKVIKQRQQEDPKALKKRIRELETEMKRRDGGSKMRQTLLTGDFEEKLEAEAAKIREHYHKERLRDKEALERKAKKILGSLGSAVEHAQALEDELSQPLPGMPGPKIGVSARRMMARREPSEPAARPTVQVDGLAKCPRALLAVLVQRDPETTTKAQLALLAGYKLRSSTFRNGLSALRTADYLGGAGDMLCATQPGVEAAGDVDPLPTGEELQRYWIQKIGKCPGAMLGELVSVYPAGLQKHELAGLSGYSLESSTFRNGLSVLRTMQLISENGVMIEASENLF